VARLKHFVEKLASVGRHPPPLPLLRHVIEITRLVGVIELDNPSAWLRRAGESRFLGKLKVAVHLSF